MFINNTIITSKNFNHLKLTPEKLVEWGDRRSSITSKYFNLSQQGSNNSQDHEINYERRTNEIHQENEKFLLFSGQENNDSNRSINESNSNSLLVSNDLLQVEKQEDNMSLDDDGFRDYLKDSEYIQNIDQSDMNLQQDYCENMNVDTEGCMGHDIKNHEISNKDNPVSENRSNLNSSIISEQNNNLPKKGSSNFLTMQDIAPTVVNHEIDQENLLHEHLLNLDALNKESHSTDNQDETYFNAKHAPQCKSIYSNEKYNKMKEDSRLRASNPNISHFMKTVIPNKKSEFDRDMEEILCDIEAYYELVQEGQLEMNQQLDYIEKSLDSLNKEFNKYRVKLCELSQDFCNQIQINILKESEEWESVFDRIGSNI